MDTPLDKEQLFEHYNITVDKGQEILRVDKFLMNKIEKTSRNKIQNAARAGCILVNEKAVKPPNEPKTLELIAEDIPLDIVYEDDTLLIVNKQAGMVVHPGFGNYNGTLVNGLVHHFKNLPQNKNFDARPGLVHRIDKLTTGLLVIAKTEYAMSHLAKAEI